MFAAVAQRLIQIMSLQAGPQDLPCSRSLLQFATAAFIASVCLRALIMTPLWAALFQAGLTVVLLIVYLRVILRWRQKLERFTQCMTALMLTGAALGLLLMVPLHALQPVLQIIAENPEVDPSQLQAPAGAMLAWVTLSLWGLIIAGHIYRQTLDTSLGIGVAVALIYEFLLLATIALFGGASA